MKRLSANQQLGQRVRALRLLRGWSQEELGTQCGIDRTYLSGVERGVRNPTVTVVAAIAAGLNVSIEDLFFAGQAHKHGHPEAKRLGAG